MDVLALVLASLALVIALIALAAAKSLHRTQDDGLADARRTARNLSDQAGRSIEALRRLTARLAAGDTVAPQMILEGQLWLDVTADEGKRMVAEEGLFVVDVRTPQETRTGVLPGATLIPLDDLEQRMREVPRSGKVLVYCAGGGRSAAACEFLSLEGYEGLHNLEGGFSSWSGPVEQPS